jgi:hypothetical protein
MCTLSAAGQVRLRELATHALASAIKALRLGCLRLAPRSRRYAAGCNIAGVRLGGRFAPLRAGRYLR